MSAQQLPREPSAWSPTPHLGDRLRKPDRHLDGEAIRACIERGDRVNVGGGRIALEAWVDGIHYRLVLDPETHEVVTGYPTEVHAQRALDAGRTQGKIREVRRAIERERPDR